MKCVHLLCFANMVDWGFPTLYLHRTLGKTNSSARTATDPFVFICSLNTAATCTATSGTDTTGDPNSSSDAAREHMSAVYCGVQCGEMQHGISLPVWETVAALSLSGRSLQPVNRKRVLEGGCHIYSGDTMVFYATLHTLNRAFIH